MSFASALDKLSVKLPLLEYCSDGSNLPLLQIKSSLEASKPVDEDSKKLESALAQIYLDLFQFLGSVTRIFMKEDGCECPSASAPGHVQTA